MLTLGWEGQPSADVIAGTLVVWMEAICANRVFDEVQDAPRFRQAFITLIQRETRWPSPSKFLEALPSNVVTFQRPSRLESEKRRKAGLENLAEIAKILRIQPPKTPEDAA